MSARCTSVLFRKHMADTDCVHELAAMIRSEMRQRPVLLLCIGSDRSTGDSLGPLVGSNLANCRLPDVVIWGTLEHPVHALNLPVAIEWICSHWKQRPVIAFDACLGSANDIGSITFCRGPLQPGRAVQKDLCPVGTHHVTGIVNRGGFMEQLVLQSTRLSLVIDMAKIISMDVVEAFQGSTWSSPVTKCSTWNIQKNDTNRFVHLPCSFIDPFH